MCRVALLGTVLALVVIAYFPFSWSPPRVVHNEVTRTAGGALRFGQMNNARTSGTPAWLPQVRASGLIQIQLEADPQSSRENASIMMLASDFWNTDFAIGQDRADLLVWLRRPGSDANGDPPFTVSGVIRPQRWNSVDVLLQPNQISVRVDDITRMTEHLPADSLQSWSPGQISLGDEVHGGDPWQGEIRLAEVRAPGLAIDYVRPGALSIPASYLYLPDHIEPFPPSGLEQWLIVFLDMLSFIPVGFLIVMARKPPVHPLLAAAVGAALAVVLAAGKFLFHARHTSLAIVVMEAVGAMLGALLASRWAHTRRVTA